MLIRNQTAESRDLIIQFNFFLNSNYLIFSFKNFYQSSKVRDHLL